MELRVWREGGWQEGGEGNSHTIHQVAVGLQLKSNLYMCRLPEWIYQAARRLLIVVRVYVQ